jgi:uncharacterized protein
LHREVRCAAAIGVGVLLGVGHMQKYLFFGAPLDDTLWQTLSAGLPGFTCAGPRFAIGSAGRWSWCTGLAS